MTTQPTARLRRRQPSIILTVTGLTTVSKPPAQWERDLIEPLLKALLDPKPAVTEVPDAPAT